MSGCNDNLNPTAINKFFIRREEPMWEVNIEPIVCYLLYDKTICVKHTFCRCTTVLTTW